MAANVVSPYPRHRGVLLGRARQGSPAELIAIAAWFAISGAARHKAPVVKPNFPNGALNLHILRRDAGVDRLHVPEIFAGLVAEQVPSCEGCFTLRRARRHCSNFAKLPELARKIC